MKAMRKCYLIRLISLALFGFLTMTGFAIRSAKAQGTQPPNPPVIFLHYDYMAPRWWDPSTGDFAPDPDAIRRVVEAFRRHGITLVIDPRHTEIPYRQYLFLGPVGPIFGGSPCAPTVCANFFDLKAQYFNPHGEQPWHYAIFGDFGYSAFDGIVSGQAELPGYDFMVTDQHFGNRTCFFGSQLDFCKEQISGLFMHELGHNLGLRHGGDVEENYKLNYVSVMNYQYQRGILYTAPDDDYHFGIWFVSPPVADAEHIAGIRLDYSDTEFPALDEYHLDERAGLGGPSNSNDVTFYFSCAASLLLPCKAGFVRVRTEPFDWDNNDAIETDVAADVNYTPTPDGHLELSRMTGYDDWSHVHEFLRTPQYVRGLLRPVDSVAEPVNGGSQNSNQ